MVYCRKCRTYVSIVDFETTMYKSSFDCAGTICEIFFRIIRQVSMLETMCLTLIANRKYDGKKDIVCFQ